MLLILPTLYVTLDTDRYSSSVCICLAPSSANPHHDFNNKTLEEIRTEEEILFLHRNETSLVSLRLLDGGVRVQEAVYGHNYTLRAEISRPDGLYFKPNV